MLQNIIPISLKKYFEMSKRQRKHEIQLTIWYMPALYITAAVVFGIISLYLDLVVELNQYTPDFFRINTASTKMLVSTLIGGILTLSAFTMNSLLVVLTTFSGQFSPRMLLNFIADKRTQHALGFFNGSFVYVLFVFLFIGNSSYEYFVAVPILTILVAFLAAITFIYFINHAATWMQVHNITYTMKESSEKIIYESLTKELEIYRCEDPNDLMEKEREEAKGIDSDQSGYLQLVDYKRMIAEAEKDQIIIQLHARIGDYTLKGNKLFSYWGPGADTVDHEKYRTLIEIGHKETELQDIHMGMHKLAEIAIKSISNDDPKTATNTIHKMAELMITVDQNITFTPYLMDNSKQVRVVLLKESFDYYIYRGFGYIRYYAKNNHLIITEIIKAFTMIAESISPTRHQELWTFAYQSIRPIHIDTLYDLDKSYLLHAMKELSELTGHTLEYRAIEERFYPEKLQG